MTCKSQIPLNTNKFKDKLQRGGVGGTSAKAWRFFNCQATSSFTQIVHKLRK